LLRVTTRRPVPALLELASERDAGLIVFGPDLGLVGRLRFLLAARRVRREADCLVWVVPDG
jgi:nucleotide-binding universal stress UspA family protein